MGAFSSTNWSGQKKTPTVTGAVTAAPVKTIADYSADYAAARAKGDAAGMKAANDGANAIRAAKGEAPQYAVGDIASVAAGSTGGSGSSGGTKLTPQKVIQDTTKPLSPAGNLAAGKGPVAAKTPEQIFKDEMTRTPAQAAGTVEKVMGPGASNVKAPVVLNPPKEDTSDYDLTEYIKQASAARVEAALAGLKGAYEKAMAGYDLKEQRLPGHYNAERNKAAVQSAIAKQNFNERAAASGLNSGTGGQAELSRSAAYQSALAGIGVAQADAQANLDLERANLTAEYQTAIAQAEATGNADLAEALYKEMIRVQGLTREDEQTAYNREQDEKAWDYKLEQADREWDYKTQQAEDAKALDSATLLVGQGDFTALGAYYGWDAATVEYMTEQYQTAQYQAAMSAAAKTAQTQADNLIKMGLMPDAATLEAAGYSQDYAQRLSAAYAAKLAGATKGGGGGGGEWNRTYTPTAMNPATGDNLERLYHDMAASGSPDTYLAMNYPYYGVAYSMLSKVTEGYKKWALTGIAQPISGLTDQVKDAVSGSVQDIFGLISGAGATTHGAVYNSLMERAEYLDKGDQQWVALADKIDQAYDDGDITDAEYTALAKAMGL